MTKDQILRKIEGLQQTRNYADEVESARLTAIIARLFELLESVPQDDPDPDYAEYQNDPAYAEYQHIKAQWANRPEAN